jgi:hypothetical protein
MNSHQAHASRARFSSRLLAFLAVGFGSGGMLVAGDASALPGRFLCPAGSVVNNNPENAGLYWFAFDQCQMRAGGSAAWGAGTAVYGSIALPLETGSSGFTAAPVARVYGGDGSNSSRPRVCVTGYAYDIIGNVASIASTRCSTGALSPQNLDTVSWTGVVPQNGSFTMNFAAEKGSGLVRLGAGFPIAGP